MQRLTYIRNLLMATMAAILIAVVFLTLVLSDMQARAFLSPRPSTPTVTPADLGLKYQEETLMTTDGIRLVAWYLPAPQPNGAGLVVVHGAGGNRSSMLLEAALLIEHGYSVLLPDLRGHGQSEGDLVTYGYLEAMDIQAAMQFLLSQPEVKDEKIGIVAISMGAAAAIRAAGTSALPQALVIQSTYSDLTTMIQDSFDRISMLPKWPFANLVVQFAERRAKVNIRELDSARDLAAYGPRPVLLIHGTADELIPLDHHDRLAQAATGEVQTWVVEGMGHDSPIGSMPQVYEYRVIGFLDEHLVDTEP